VIVKDSVANKEPVRVAVNAGQLGGKSFRATVRARGPERRLFRLRRLRGAPKNFGAGGVIKFYLFLLVPRDFEQPQRRHSDLFASRLGNLETQTDMALAGEMINLRRTHLGENAAERGPIGEIAIMEKETLVIDVFIAAQMLDARAEKIACSPNDSMNGIAFFQQQLGQIRAVLTSDAGYERSLRILVHRSEIPQTQFNEAVLSHKKERVSSCSNFSRHALNRSV